MRPVSLDYERHSTRSHPPPEWVLGMVLAAGVILWGLLLKHQPVKDQQGGKRGAHLFSFFQPRTARPRARR